jgi:hypothetical protein
MADDIIFRPPPEPAHVSIVRQYEDLVAILKYIREEGQGVIDQGFDRVSSQIGFVVAASLPVTVEVAETGKIKQLTMREEHLKGTLFDKELLPPLMEHLEAPIMRRSDVPVGEGAFDIYLLWFDALKLKLGSISIFRPHLPIQELAPLSTARTMFAEELARIWPGYGPRRPIQELAPLSTARTALSAELAGIGAGGRSPHPYQEPPHWFDSRIQITQREQALIVALDEVYPELHLVERINACRQGQTVFLNPQPLPPRALVQKLEELLAGPQPQPWMELVKFLVAELESEGQVPESLKVKRFERLIDFMRRHG